MAKRPEPAPSCPNCAALSVRPGELEVLVAKLGAELERIKSRKPKTSRTSNKPPSSDGPWAPRDTATLRQSGRPLSDFALNVAHAVLAGGPSPKLLG